MASPAILITCAVFALLHFTACQYMIATDGMVSMVTNGEGGPVYAQMAPLPPLPQVVIADEPMLVTVAEESVDEAPAEEAAAITNGNGAEEQTRMFFRANGNGYAAAAPAPAPEAITNGYTVLSNGARTFGFFRSNNNGKGFRTNGNGYGAAPAPAEPAPAPTPEAITNGYGTTVTSNGGRTVTFFRANGNGNGYAVAPAPEPAPAPVPEAITNEYGTTSTTNGGRTVTFFRANGNGNGYAVAPAPAAAPAAETITNGGRIAQFFRTNGNGYGAEPAEPAPAPVAEAITNGYDTVSTGLRTFSFIRTNSNGGYGAAPVEPVPEATPAPITNGYGSASNGVTPLPAPAQFLPTELAEGVSIPQIPGVAGVDYPIFSQALVSTEFDCNERSPGYYAYKENKCQVFQVCEPNMGPFVFLCPNGTMFNEKYSVCDWWYNVNCEQNVIEPIVQAYGPPPPAPIVQLYAPPPPPPPPAPIVQLYAPPPPPPPPAPIVQTYTPPPPPPPPAPIVQIYTPPPPPPPPAPIQQGYGAEPVAPEEPVVVTEVIDGEPALIDPAGGEVAAAAKGNGREALRLFRNFRLNRLQPQSALRFRFNGLRNENGYQQVTPAVVEEVAPEVVPEITAPVTNGGGYGEQAVAAVTNANGGRRFKNVIRMNQVRVNGLRTNGNGYQQPAPVVEEVAPEVVTEVAPATNGGGYNSQAAAPVTNGGRRLKNGLRANRFRANGLRNNGQEYQQPTTPLVEEVAPAVNGGGYNGQSAAPAALANGNGGRKLKNVRVNQRRVNGLRSGGNGQYGATPAPIQNGYGSAGAVNGNGQEAALIMSNGEGGAVAANGNGVVAVNGDTAVTVNGNGQLNVRAMLGALGLNLRSSQLLRSGGLKVSAYTTGQETEAIIPANGDQLAFGARF